jgi:bifunctional non-homologous end joining protein LigD
MLLRSAPLPQRAGYAYEPKWDGFRALVSTAGGRLVVRSRRRWDMTDLVPELADLPPGLVLDGELIAFGEDGLPSFPRLCRRMLAGQRAIQIMFVVFDLLAEDGESLVALPYRARRERLDPQQIASIAARSAHRSLAACLAAQQPRPAVTTLNPRCYIAPLKGPGPWS